MPEETNKNLEFLVGKSRDLLQEQLKSFENCNNKAGILISISSLFVPIAISFVTSNELPLAIKVISLVSVLTSVTAIYYLLKVTNPKGLDHGFNFAQFETKANGNYTDLLVYEISANKSSYEDNEKIVLQQVENLRCGLKSIFLSVIILLVAGFGMFFTKPSFTESYKQIDIENLNIKNMEENNQQTGSDNQNSQSSQQSSQQSDTSQQSTIRFDTIPSNERANIQKGDDSKPLTKESKN